MHLSTAHLCKGLEHDNVILGDDFNSTIDVFSKGKVISEADLYLIYVAVTHAKKTLVLPDVLFESLQTNSAFKVNKTKAAECLTDNLGQFSKTAQANSGAEPVSKLKEKSSSLESSSQQTAKRESKTVRNKPTATPDSLKQEQATRCSNNPLRATEGDSEAIAVHIGTDKETNKNLYWIPTDTSQYFNPNFAVLGTMGTGKTQAVKSLLYQLKQQERLNTNEHPFGLLIFDYKNDYTDDKFVNATGAVLTGQSHTSRNDT